MTRRAIESDKAKAVGPYSLGIEAGGFAFISGQTPLDPATGKLVEGDIAAQTRQCFRNLEAVLSAAGLGFQNVVKSTVFLVDPAQDAITSVTSRSMNHEPLGTLTFDGACVAGDAVVGAVDGGAEVVSWITDRALVGLCALQAGVCEAALRLTATYTSERKQFDTPIATFQAVAHRAADAYIDTEAIRLTAHQAAWRLGEGLPAAEEVAIAKFWAAEGAERVVHAAQHLHGGIGVDLDYPVHRTFRWAKHVEMSLGGGTVHLGRLGALLAAG